MDNDKRFGINALKIAALIGVGLFTTVQAQAIEDYTGTYGTGSNSVNYNWVTDINGNKKLEKTTETNSDIKVQYTNKTNRIVNENKTATDSTNVEFIELTSNYRGAAIYAEKSSFNTGIINGIFANNNVTVSGKGYGGAIYTPGKIAELNADFIGNTVITTTDNAVGGAVSVDGAVGNISGDFIGNGVYSQNYVARGGALAFYSSVGEIKDGKFIGNYAISDKHNAYGGAINNAGNNSITSITTDFINNYVYSGAKAAWGGAINNASSKSIGEINSNFSNNYVFANSDYAAGGAISNEGEISKITGTQTGNHTTSLNGTARGGFLSNLGKIENGISGTITNNYVKSENSNAFGGAIYNKGTIGDITTNFTNNYAQANIGFAAGGAISNDNKIGNISGTQTGNYASSISEVARGGFLSNAGSIDNIDGNFTDNFTTSQNNKSSGGAINNYGSIKNITANFTNNYSISQNAGAYGGAINNQTGSSIQNIEGIFTNNYTNTGANAAAGGAIANDGTILNINSTNISGNYTASTDGVARGGFISNAGSIGDITGTITENFAKSNNEGAYGGAIYIASSGKTEDINANFTKNYVESNEYRATGGAITNLGEIKNISGEQKENYAASVNGKALGGFINSSGTIKNITGSFSKNSAVSTNSNAFGGAISNTGKIDDIIADFSDNSVASGTSYSAGGAIYNEGIIKNIEGNFKQNFVTSNKGNARGGFLSNLGEIEKVTGTISDNYTQSQEGNAYGAGVYVYTTGIVNEINSNFSNNHTYSGNGYASGAALFNDGKINSIVGDFTNNYVQSSAEVNNAYAGALHNRGEIGTITGNFINNYAVSDSSSSLAFAGAIYTSKDIQLLADAKDIIFSGNYTQDNVRGTTPTAIFAYVDDTDPAPTLTFNAKNSGTIQFDDGIDGGSYTKGADGNTKIEYNNHYNLKIDGDETTTVNFNNYIKNANIIHNGGTTNVNAMQYLNYASGEGINSLTMNGGVLNIGSLGVMPLGLNSFAINGGTINIDNVQVDLANQTMGRISAENYGTSSGGNINIASMTLLSDGKDAITPVLFADESFKNNVTTDVTSIMGEVYKYDVTYDTTKYGPGGHFVFARSSENIANYNPSAVVTPVAAQAGAQVTQLESLYTGFAHIDRFTKFSHAQRQAMINANKYAINDLTTIKRNSIADKEQSVWAKPYTGFESISLRGGLNVSATSYGSIFGGDSGLIDLGKGYTGVISSFVGYNGSHLSYNGININNNGGVLGFTGTLYKGNFFTGLTASTGASAGEGHTYFGTDHFTMLSAGVANKTGYNFEFNDGKLIIQPQVFVGYTFVNTFDYTAASGVKMESDPLHSIQIVPGVRVIGNLGDGWQPYASVNMVWNIMDKTKVKANDAMLPQLSMKPYVEYGVGLQKTIGERFTGYFQSMIRNGGRTGVVLSAGFKWAIGKDTKPKSIDTVNKPTTDKKVLKSKKKLLSLAK